MSSLLRPICATSSAYMRLLLARSLRTHHLQLRRAGGGGAERSRLGRLRLGSTQFRRRRRGGGPHADSAPCAISTAAECDHGGEASFARLLELRDARVERSLFVATLSACARSSCSCYREVDSAGAEGGGRDEQAQCMSVSSLSPLSASPAAFY